MPRKGDSILVIVVSLSSAQTQHSDRNDLDPYAQEEWDPQDQPLYRNEYGQPMYFPSNDPRTRLVQGNDGRYYDISNLRQPASNDGPLQRNGMPGPPSRCKYLLRVLT